MNNDKFEGKALNNFGTSLILVAMLVAGLVIAFSDSSYLLENIIFLTVTIAIVYVAAASNLTLAIVFAGLETVTFIGYKVFKLLNSGEKIPAVSFLWVIVPALGVVGAGLCVSSQKKLLLENGLLKRQVDELVMIDTLTGFYNLRSMFMDMQTQVSFAERNNKPISLMVVKLKYHEQLKQVLRKNQYEQVLIKLSKYIADTVRLEDRVYCIDDEGSIAIILTTDRNGCKIVANRLRNKLDNPEAFADIASKPIRAEVKIGYLQYKKEEFQRDARLFLSRVEEETEYDI